MQTLKLDAPFAISIAFSPDGQVLAVADGVHVRFWNPRTGKPAAEVWKLESDPHIIEIPMYLAFLDNKTLAMSRNRHDITLREYPSGRELRSIDFGQPVRRDGWVVAPGLLACAGRHDNECDVRLLTGPKWQEAWCAKLGDEFPRAFAFSPDRTELAIGTDGGSLRIYSVADGKLLRSTGRPAFPIGELREIAYSPDGREIAFWPAAQPRARPSPDGWSAVSFLDAKLVSQRTFPWGGRSDKWCDAIGCAFSADGKTLIVPCLSNTVRLYEVQTGKLRHIGEVPTLRNRFAVSPDGKLFASAVSGKVLIVDWRAAKSEGPLAPHQATLWDDLASLDAAKGYRAVVALGATPVVTAQLIGDNLKPAAIPKAAVVKARIADLAADDFATRETAQKELAQFLEMVEPELREAAKSDSPERRNRATELLKALSRRDNPERLRYLRAVEVLEYINTPASREVLKTLAGGVPTAGLTLDAKAALARLEMFDPKP